MTTETRTFVGETGTRAHDAWAGFVIDRQYQLSYTKEFDEVRLQIPHGSPGAVPLVLTSAEFEKWFRK